MNETFDNIYRGKCEKCKSVNDLNKDNNCPYCWHDKIKEIFPHACKNKGIWKAYQSRDDLPSPPGQW